jgi:hypothetical protein
MSVLRGSGTLIGFSRLRTLACLAAIAGNARVSAILSGKGPQWGDRAVRERVLSADFVEKVVAFSPETSKRYPTRRIV